MYDPGLFFVVICCLHVNNIVCKHDNMLLDGLLLILIAVQSYISVPYLVFEIRLSKLNDNNYNNKRNWFETDYAI